MAAAAITSQRRLSRPFLVTNVFVVERNIFAMTSQATSLPVSGKRLLVTGTFIPAAFTVKRSTGQDFASYQQISVIAAPGNWYGPVVRRAQMASNGARERAGGHNGEG
jgi:hypothetical protein